MPTAPHRSESKVLKASILITILVFSLILAPQPHTRARAVEATYTTYTAHSEKGAIMRQANYYVKLGVDYNQYTWSCSDFTRAVYGNSIGVWMPDWDDQQLGYGRPTAGLKDPLKRGDLVFFKEHRGDGPVTHVAVYSGHGMVAHSSAYWGYTTKTAMMYIEGYVPSYTRRIR